jgi:glyoxylase-like metal-dependent hydrolase (beta-lactamase superfamily II)
MCPRGAKLLKGSGGLLEAAPTIAHCLVLESAEGLVLVDTGFGTNEVRDPGRIPALGRAIMRPQFAMEETAVRRVEAMGHDAADVRHVILTHLDADHAGGLADFPAAKVHLFRPELDFAQSAALKARLRYEPVQWSHGPDWSPHEVDGDTWFGFESVRPIPGLGDDVALVPLVGHTRGHAGVAVRTGEGWLLHCGDAFFFAGEVETPRRCPPGLRAFQNITQDNRGARHRNQERLRELARAHGAEVQLICSHDPSMLEPFARS